MIFEHSQVTDGVLLKKGQKKGQFLILASEATKATPLAWPAS
jgi:hypothetical protein